MLLTELSVDNFGVFQGKHSFNLRTDPDGRKPIILFGGRNGTGKTTLFDGIKLCLYGQSFRGHRLSRQQYEEFLRGKIHRHQGLTTSEGSSVSLEFEHVHQGRTSRYFARRSWTVYKDETIEKLEILRDGRFLDDIESQQLQDFLIELIPVGMSKLFFFDGEQIQKLAEDEPNNRNLIDAFNALLGIDIIEHLETDLRIHLSRQGEALKTEGPASYDSAVAENRTLELESSNLRQDQAQIQSEIDFVRAEIERKEHELAKEGGGFADQRQGLKARRNELISSISQLEARAREQASSLLPFAIVSDLCVSLRSRLVEEEVAVRKLAAKELFASKVNDLHAMLEREEFWDGTSVKEEYRRILRDRLTHILGRNLAPDVLEPKLVHGLSPGEQQKLSFWIDKTVTMVSRDFLNVSKELESNIIELRRVEQDISRVPLEEAVSPLVRQLNELNQKLGERSRDERLAGEKIKQLDFRSQENNRKVRRFLESQHQSIALRSRIDLGSRVQGALRSFAKELRKDKTNEVAIHFTIAFNRLCAKKNMISAVVIDPDDFQVTLLRKNGSKVAKEELSAGEKQIYAISMLTALAQVSGRPLPFVIDTPLARLDLEHRSNLVSRFFPKAGHQVIIFSTNSEIDQKFFIEMQSNIARSYLLEYEESTGSSSVQTGYFWQENLEVTL